MGKKRKKTTFLKNNFLIYCLVVLAILLFLSIRILRTSKQETRPSLVFPTGITISPNEKVIYYSSTPTTSYISKKGKLRFQFKQPMYVFESYIPAFDDLIHYGINISFNKEYKDNYLHVGYGIPYIHGKGGGCSASYQTKIILNQEVVVCDQEKDLFFSSQYPKHPTEEIEYHFSIHNKGKILEKDFEQFRAYKDIIYNGISFSE